MRRMNLVLCAFAGAVPLAGAQVTLYLENTQDVSVLSDSVNAPNFFVGNNPSVIALVGDSLFVAGYNNTTAPTCKMVKIEDIFGTRAFRDVPSSAVPMPTFRGFYGLQYDHGPARAGLVLNYDSGGIGTAGAFRLYDVDSQLNPILLEESPAGTSARGGAGPAFDYGFDGLGFDLDADGQQDGPVLSILDFAGYPGNLQSRGPFGIRLRDQEGLDNGLSVILGRIYDADSVDGMSQPIAPIINTAGSNGVAVSGTLWRDISIDYRNGNLAARADNDLVIGRRNPLNGLLSHVVVSCTTTDACGSVPFQIMQRCEILVGNPSGDVVVYNEYGTGQSDLTAWIKAVDLDGQPVAINFLNADGSPFSVPNTSGIMDLSWDPENGRLAVCDFNGRNVYIFSTTPPPPPCGPCFADYNQDGGVDGGDVEAFFMDWESASGCSDTNEDGGVDGGDVETFFSQWENGGC